MVISIPVLWYLVQKFIMFTFGWNLVYKQTVNFICTIPVVQYHDIEKILGKQIHDSIAISSYSFEFYVIIVSFTCFFMSFFWKALETFICTQGNDKPAMKLVSTLVTALLSYDFYYWWNPYTIPSYFNGSFFFCRFGPECVIVQIVERTTRSLFDTFQLSRKKNIKYL